MVRLKERKLAWAFKQKEKGEKNKELAFLVGVKKRRFQQLYAEYKMTGRIPELNWKRRPKIKLNSEEEMLINKALEESKMNGAVYIGLFIKKYYNKNISHNKIHEYLLREKIAKEDKEKQKQRVYKFYERDHSFSLVHLDWHDSDCIPGKHVCVVEDDASRKILSGGEFDNEYESYVIKLVKEATNLAYQEYSAVIRECNTDQGTQFYGTKKDSEGERSRKEFEEFLEKIHIKHIPSRKHHPETNGKEERWFGTYEKKRMLFKTFKEFINWYNNKLNLGLSRKEGITPNEAIQNKLQPEAILGLFFRLIDRK
jgi:transposase InsO family protein